MCPILSLGCYLEVHGSRHGTSTSCVTCWPATRACRRVSTPLLGVPRLRSWSIRITRPRSTESFCGCVPPSQTSFTSCYCTGLRSLFLPFPRAPLAVELSNSVPGTWGMLLTHPNLASQCSPIFSSFRSKPLNHISCVVEVSIVIVCSNRKRGCRYRGRRWILVEWSSMRSPQHTRKAHADEPQISIFVDAYLVYRVSRSVSISRPMSNQSTLCPPSPTSKSPRSECV